MSRLSRILLLCLLTLAQALPLRVVAAETPSASSEPQPSPQQQAFIDALKKLDWVKGPSSVDVPGKSKLQIPEGYVFLDQGNTDKYLELTHNLPSGTDVMVGPADLHWVAYLSFADEGYVKDDEKIDAPALLKSLQEGAQQSNEERRRRGWAELSIVGWAVQPAYNASNHRLEWATILESQGERGVNFSTKVLARRGHTSVILVCAPETLNASRTQLETVLGGYSFDQGERYADWVPGDKVATYGLAALVLGGAAAIATKKGLWAVIGAFIIAKIKLLIAGGAALFAGLRRFFTGKKKADDPR
ncbi:MAG: DUF2167 domain-containing protein [Pseudomonadota bacterium]